MTLRFVNSDGVGELDGKLRKSADDVFRNSFGFFVVIVLAFFPSGFVDFIFAIVDANLDAVG